MKLIEALEIVNDPISSPEIPPVTVFLATGSTPLHLQTFLTAHLRSMFASRSIVVKTGSFGDLAGNIERVDSSDCDALAAVIEWSDLDQRLGFRHLGGWQPQALPDILQSVAHALARLKNALRHASESLPVCICLPTLPLPPVFTTATQQAGRHELQLRALLAGFGEELAQDAGVRILNPQCLDTRSAPGSRLDLAAEMAIGFPYQLEHASQLGELLAALIRNLSPKKGLITDLDDTLWAGILGEVGVQGISWDLDSHTQKHGLYQQLLASLASAGVMLAAASKNSPALVAQAFHREDLILRKEQVFPIEIHWSRKSESVHNILRTWNVAADDVVFVDDSPMEVAEVQSAFPEMEALVFPSDTAAFRGFLNHLRDIFGRAGVTAEDLIRLQSVRSAAAFQNAPNSSSAALDDFLRRAESCVEVSFDKRPEDARALELINKTNQFNLNGKRLTPAAWNSYLQDPASFSMTVSYRDKYGPSGKIAVLLGKRLSRRAIQVDFWVMSCRVLSRRIEHQCLRQVFERFDAHELYFDYQCTPRNGPLQEFFAGLVEGPTEGRLRVPRDAFWQKSPRLFHDVREAIHA